MSTGAAQCLAFSGLDVRVFMRVLLRVGEWSSGQPDMTHGFVDASSTVSNDSAADYGSLFSMRNMAEIADMWRRVKDGVRPSDVLWP